MPNKTRIRKDRTTTTTTGSARTLRSVPDQTIAAKVRTDAEDKLWAALHAHPNSAAADLSGAARIGKSTAQKILVKWASDGSVTRTAGIAEGGRRAADLWAVADVDAAAAAAAAGEQGDGASTHDATPAEGNPTEAGDLAESAGAEAIEPTTDDDADTVADSGGDEKADRLAPGALRGMVEDYLRDHPGEEFGPTAIAKALGGKSSGAVSNALDKLVADNTAVKTKDKPRRFALAPAEAPAAPTN